jgi:signal transduction histidine kinase
MEKFTVDTHVFRELGELLVGRDSTALAELIKNSYDADATEVLVEGRNLDDPERGTIIIKDTGVGMTPTQFREGFLRIASRLKEGGERKSPLYKRRYTGAKGIGRLAAHKLAKYLRVYSIPHNGIGHQNSKAVDATIDWSIVESQETLDDLENTQAITVREEEPPKNAHSGTVIELRGLRRHWTRKERARFLAEAQSFEPPHILISLASKAKGLPLLFSEPKIRDSRTLDPGFKVELAADLEAGDDYWPALLQASHWLIEIDSRKPDMKVRYSIVPTRKALAEYSDAKKQTVYLGPHPTPQNGPFFHARILLREGGGGKQDEKAWLGRSAGIRVYMEGFRVLPYGEPGDDWLSIDADYKKRQHTLTYLSELGFAGQPADETEGHQFLANSHYFGAVFLTQSDSPTLRMLVNREGFLPNAEFDSLVHIVKTAVHLATRVRAAAKPAKRAEWRDQRKGDTEQDLSRFELRKAVEVSVKRATDLASEAKRFAIAGSFTQAKQKIDQAAALFSEASNTSYRLMSEGAMLRVLASVGTQMAAFVHEINGLLESAISLESAIAKIREDAAVSEAIRKQIAPIQSAIGDLRRSVERQALYLMDVVSPDARRRRSRQSLAERFDAGKRIVEFAAQRKGIKIINDIPPDLKSPAMFPAELTLVFSNLLTNAVKAAGHKGKIRALARLEGEDTILRVENTGATVNPAKGERWFKPFESTTVQPDPILGQGMGMGLPITRNILEEYGASIRFVRPGSGYKTALEIRLSE